MESSEEQRLKFYEPLDKHIATLSLEKSILFVSREAWLHAASVDIAEGKQVQWRCKIQFLAQQAFQTRAGGLQEFDLLR